MNKQDWGTPQDLFDRLHQEFKFTLDASASKDNAKLNRFISEADNSLLQPWDNERVFLHPPSLKPEYPCKKGAKGNSLCKKKICKERGFHATTYIPGVSDWVNKCHHEAKKGTLIVALLPAKTGTIWWHDYIWDMDKTAPYKDIEIRFIKGRLHFNGTKESAPFDSVIIIWNKSENLDI